MSGRRTHASKGARKASYPALRAFCRGYLHEDALTEHGSASAAVDAFRADASAEEQRALEADWRRFSADTEGWPVERVAERLRDTLGAAWQPEDRDDLTRFAGAIAPPRSRH